MAKKDKPVYSVTTCDDVAPAAVYSCLKTLCEAWGIGNHYSTVWKWLARRYAPYQDGNITIKKHILIKSKYERKN